MKIQKHILKSRIERVEAKPRPISRIIPKAMANRVPLIPPMTTKTVKMPRAPITSEFVIPETSVSTCPAERGKVSFQCSTV